MKCFANKRTNKHTDTVLPFYLWQQVITAFSVSNFDKDIFFFPFLFFIQQSKSGGIVLTNTEKPSGVPTLVKIYQWVYQTNKNCYSHSELLESSN